MSDLIILSSSDVDRVIETMDLDAALQSQADVFKAYSTKGSTGDIPPIQTPQRLTIQSELSTSLFMPARVSGQGTAIKIVSIPKSGGNEGLPATTLVMDDQGRVRGIVNARKLTALRNACGMSTLMNKGSYLQGVPSSYSSVHHLNRPNIS